MLQSSQRISSVCFLFPGTEREKGSPSLTFLLPIASVNVTLCRAITLTCHPRQKCDPIGSAAIGSVRTQLSCPTLRANKHHSMERWKMKKRCEKARGLQNQPAGLVQVDGGSKLSVISCTYLNRKLGFSLCLFFTSTHIFRWIWKNIVIYYVLLWKIMDCRRYDVRTFATTYELSGLPSICLFFLSQLHRNASFLNCDLQYSLQRLAFNNTGTVSFK